MTSSEAIDTWKKRMPISLAFLSLSDRLIFPLPLRREISQLEAGIDSFLPLSVPSSIMASGGVIQDEETWKDDEKMKHSARRRRQPAMETRPSRRSSQIWIKCGTCSSRRRRPLWRQWRHSHTRPADDVHKTVDPRHPSLVAPARCPPAGTALRFPSRCS